jgi:membrane-bound ClpP family serine protease
MTLIVLLFSLGILFVAIEVLVPGGILGAIGGAMVVAGVVVAFVRYGTSGGVVAITVGAAMAGIAFYIEFKILPHTRVGRRAFLTKEITAVSRAVGLEAQDLVGKSAEAITMLSPTGYVRVDGNRYEAFSQSGQVPAGAVLEVIGADSFRLIVTNRKSHL